MRPYQTEANRAIEQAIADHKRQMLIAMATGSSTICALVNQVYRPMSKPSARGSYSR